MHIQNYLVVDYHGSKGNRSQIGDLLHSIKGFINEIDLLILVAVVELALYW